MNNYVHIDVTPQTREFIHILKERYGNKYKTPYLLESLVRFFVDKNIPIPDPLFDEITISVPDTTINRKEFIKPIKPGAFTHVYQHLPLEYESIRPSMKGKPLPVSNVVREELPYDPAGKATVRYTHKPSGKSIPKPPVVDETVYTAENYPLTDEMVLEEYNRQKDERMKNKFDLRDDK